MFVPAASLGAEELAHACTPPGYVAGVGSRLMLVRRIHTGRAFNLCSGFWLEDTSMPNGMLTPMELMGDLMFCDKIKAGTYLVCRVCRQQEEGYKRD
jgi:hypothetical protein